MANQALLADPKIGCAMPVLACPPDQLRGGMVGAVGIEPTTPPV